MVAICASTGLAQQAPAAGRYKVLKTAKVGGDGGFDYVNVDAENRRLYIARTGKTPRINVYNLDTLEPVGEVMTTNAHGAVIDPKTSHGFATTKPITMFDSKTLATIKTIEVQGNPDGAFFEASNQAGDGKGHLYIDVEDKDNIAVVDTKTLDVTAHYDIGGKGGTCAGLAMDAKNHILFAACRNPANMVILNADDGKIITTLPIGMGTDGASFNPNTMEAFSSQGIDGTLTIVRENSPTDFVVEQTLPTMNGARTSALDIKTNHIILIAAEFGPPTPPAQPGGRPGRGQIVPDSFSILVVGK
jgi:DNA-binding beta-propeller fold protein YncE